MTNIVPISDMKNYFEVLGHCDDGSVVYLTKFVLLHAFPKKTQKTPHLGLSKISI